LIDPLSHAWQIGGMATGKGKKRDFTQIAKAVIDKVTGNAPPDPPDTRNPPMRWR